MKTLQNQKSILSFFGPTIKGNRENVDSRAKNELRNNSKKSPKKFIEEDSPIKKVSRRRTRTIESDSEEDSQPSTSHNEEEENKISTPDKKRSRTLSPVSEVSEKYASGSSQAKPSTSKQNVGFSPETVPPLRKTARKQMHRSTDSTEEHQVRVIKKLKSSPLKQETETPDEKETRKTKIEKVEVEKIDSTKKPKRTNCLDRFVFTKTSKSTKTVSTDEKTNEKNVSTNSPKETSEPSKQKLGGDHCLAFDRISSPETTCDTSPTNTAEKSTSPKIKTPSPEVNTTPKSSSLTEKNKTPEIKTITTTESSITSTEIETTDFHSSATIENSASQKCSSPAIEKSVSLQKRSSPSPAKITCEVKPVVKNVFSLAKQSTDKNAFSPAKSKYHPIEDASWKKGEDVPFAALSKTFEIIQRTSGRLKTIEILSNFLRSVIVLSPEDFLCCVYLCLNKVAPSFEGIELGVGEIYVCRAIAQATGRSVNVIKNEITEKGDLGIVAEHSKSNQRTMFQPARLTVKNVFKNVKEIALMSGQASQTKKIDKIKLMLVACKGSEARFLIRFFGGKLRIGLAEQSVLQAISQACFMTPPDQSYPPEILNAGEGVSADNLKAKVEQHAAILKTTYCECPSFDLIIPILLEKGMKELPNHCKLQPGIPLKPMLAHPTKGVSEVLKRFEKLKFTCEFKYDGERAQIHLKEDGTVNIFSRNQEDNTSKYPDIIARFKNSLESDVKSCIIDSEAVAYDVKEKKILPFQILSTRKKKDANESEIKVQVCVFPFDVLYLNGQNLVTEPLEVRRDLLRKNFLEKEGQFIFAKSMDSTNTEDIEEFLEESIKGNCEGLMMKSLDVEATYEISKRSRNWLKLKKDYLEGVGDTIDVVVIGGFLGKGKRTGTYGGFLLACYDPENEEFQSLCKIGTGFTEDALQKHTAFLKERVIESPKSYYRFDNSMAPDHWFDPVQVWEIKCADLSISPVHRAAIGIADPEKGISLRFPRFLRIRDDKTPEDATSASQIADMYRNQEQIKNQTSSNNVEDDFY